MATFIKGDPAAPEPDDGTTVVYDRAKNAYVPGPTPGGGGGGGGVTVHGELTGRSAPDQHPIDAVTGLQSALDDKAATGHDHDDRYYTESEVDSALAGKANTTHQHPVSDLTATGTPSETTYLRGDGAWATPEGGGGGSGIDWAWPQVAPSVPRIALPPHSSGSSGVNPNLYLTGLLVPYGAITDVGVEISTGAAATLRLGIYATDPNGTRPETLLADAGIVDAATSGWKIITLTTPIPHTGGPLWVGVYRMSTSTDSPQVRNAGQLPINTVRDHFNWGSNGLGSGLYQSGVNYDTGLPATITIAGGTFGSFQPMRVGIKVQ